MKKILLGLLLSIPSISVSAEYAFTATPTVIKRTRDDAYIPTDPANVDYQKFQKWVAEGNVPDPYVPPEPEVKPQPVTADEILDALLSGTDLNDIRQKLGELRGKHPKELRRP